MPGPRAKPDARRQRANARPSLGIVKAGGAGDLEVVFPPPRSAWIEQTTEDYRAYVASPLANLIAPADLPALLRLFDYRDELAVTMRRYTRRRVVEGSMGQPTLSPYAKMIAPLESAIAKLEDRFGLTPDSRLKLGITFGEAARTLDDLNDDLTDDERGDHDDEASGVDDDPRLVVLPGEVVRR